MARTTALQIVLLAAAFFVACDTEKDVTPSMVGRAWEIGIGPGAEQRASAGTVSFSSISKVDVYSYADFGPRRTLYYYPDIPSLAFIGTTSFSLPPPPKTLAAIQETGLKIFAMSYCGFVNGAGEPRAEDEAAVDEAVSVFLDAVTTPMRDAAFDDESLEAAGRLAADVLFTRVLEELEMRGSRDPWADSAFVRVLETYTSRAEDDPVWGRPRIELDRISEFIPDLVWTFGDATTRATLSGCGTALVFDAPQALVLQEFPSMFNGYCPVGENPSARSPSCSLEALAWRGDNGRREAALILHNPIDGRGSANWLVTVDVDVDDP